MTDAFNSASEVTTVWRCINSIIIIIIALKFSAFIWLRSRNWNWYFSDVKKTWQKLKLKLFLKQQTEYKLELAWLQKTVIQKL